MKKVFLLIFLLPVFVLANGYGIATLVKGSVQILTSDGQNKIIKRGDKVFESDTIITASKSVVRVVMVDTNIIDIYPNSKVLIKQYIYSPQEDNKNVRLEVSSGQIKSTVKQKYDNEKNKYNVKTPSIVAGVRGTIFTTEHEAQTGTSRVFTHEGNVMVGKLDAQENVREFFSVKANQQIQIDNRIERPQVIDTPKIEIQKQQSVDKEDGFVKVDRESKNNRSDSARPAMVNDSGGQKNMDGVKSGENNSIETRKSPSARDSGSKDEGGKSEGGKSEGSKSEVKEPARNEPRQEPDRERKEPDSSSRDQAPPAALPDRDSSRPDSDESKKEIKKRLQEELKRLKREQAKRSRKDR